MNKSYLIIVFAILTFLSSPYRVSERECISPDEQFAFTATYQNQGAMLSSAPATVPAITESPQTAPAAKGNGGQMLSRLSGSSLIRQRDIENIYRMATVISGEARSASLEPLKRYFVFAIGEIII